MGCSTAARRRCAPPMSHRAVFACLASEAVLSFIVASWSPGSDPCIFVELLSQCLSSAWSCISLLGLRLLFSGQRKACLLCRGDDRPSSLQCVLFSPYVQDVLAEPPVGLCYRQRIASFTL